MKKVTFTNITLQDFCAHRGLKSFDLGHRTFIKGANETGKSTLKKAIQYALNICAENGKEITGIRPHDENGVDIDGLTTMSQLTVSVDGTENTVKKTFFQKKNRDGAYTGENDTQYFVDDVKKGTKKAYDEFIGSFLPNSLCINPQEFLLKNTADRRTLLEQAFSKHSVDDIIAKNPEFEELRGKLKANTVADLKKACRTKIDGTKAENYQDGLNGQLAKVNHQIEFEQANKKSIDLAELELQRNALKEQIADIEAKEADVSKQYEEYDKQSKDILDLQFALSDLERKANEENLKKRIDTENDIRAFKMERDSIEINKKELVERIRFSEQVINGDNSVEKCREEYTTALNRVFDENSLVCSYCGQEYPAEKKEQLKAEFESHKEEELKRITEKGVAAKERHEKAKEELKSQKEELLKLQEELFQIEKKISELEKQLSELPDRIDISDREDYKQLKQQISDKEQAMQNCNSADEIRQELRDKKSELQSQLIEVEAQFKVAEEYEKNNEKADMEIEKLKKQRMEIVQQTADIQRELDLLKQFERKKAEILEDDVNENFEFVQFRMFEKMVGSDELKDVCQVLVGGESYDRNLNYSNRLLAEVDICLGFQRKYEIIAPILIDNIESIDPARIPNIKNQLIMFKRDDSKTLKAEIQ